MQIGRYPKKYPFWFPSFPFLHEICSVSALGLTHSEIMCENTPSVSAECSQIRIFNTLSPITSYYIDQSASKLEGKDELGPQHTCSVRPLLWNTSWRDQ